MKTAFFVLIFNLLLLSQSVILFQPGTHLIVEVGANIIAGNVIINGTFSGGGTINGLPIPVELTFFHASITDKIATLVWQTATETNNKGFEIEKSAGSASLSASMQDTVRNWEAIGFVKGAGTTTDLQNYFFADEKSSNGKFFYRLKQIDFDGSFNYSNEVEVVVNIPYTFSLSQNYPNPFNPSTKIKFSIPSVETLRATSLRIALKIYDILGNEVATLVDGEREPGEYEVEFDASSHSSGVYLCTIRAGNVTQSIKIVLMK